MWLRWTALRDVEDAHDRAQRISLCLCAQLAVQFTMLRKECGTRKYNNRAGYALMGPLPLVMRDLRTSRSSAAASAAARTSLGLWSAHSDVLWVRHITTAARIATSALTHANIKNGPVGDHVSNSSPPTWAAPPVDAPPPPAAPMPHTSA